MISKRPRTLQQFRDHPAVDMVSDERDCNSGIWIYFKPGWINYMTETHCIHEETVRECIDYWKYVVSCDCEDCKNARV
jgi:hypothetical protein